MLSAFGATLAICGPAVHAASRMRPVVMSADVGAAATTWQPGALRRVTSALALEAKPYAADLGFDSFSLPDGSAGSVSSYELSGKAANVAWCSGLLMSGTVCRGSVTAWCGPLTDVPHLTAASGVSNGGIDLLIDFKVRAECGYTPSGQYEEPQSREAFAQGSNRKDFAQAFFTDDVVAWRASLLSLPGAEVSTLRAEQMQLVGASPVRICLRLPLTASAASAASAACDKAVDLWLGWAVGAVTGPRALGAGAKQTSTYARDTKLRANAYGELLGIYTSLVGDAGKDLAAADAGPLDEAYVRAFQLSLAPPPYPQ